MLCSSFILSFVQFVFWPLNRDTLLFSSSSFKYFNGILHFSVLIDKRFQTSRIWKSFIVIWREMSVILFSKLVKTWRYNATGVLIFVFIIDSCVTQVLNSEERGLLKTGDCGNYSRSSQELSFTFFWYRTIHPNKGISMARCIW